MKRIAAALLFGLALFAAPSAFAQSIMQCAYNSSPSTVPSPSAVSVQCSNTGYILFAPASGSVYSVNLTQILGAAPSLTNPLWVTPATGATFTVTQGTASSLNATVVGTAGAALATAALQTTGNTSLASILTALGSPFQAGGSIGNTTFTVTQGTGTNLHVVCDSGCSSSSSPTFGAAFPTTGTPVGASNGTDLEPLLVNGSGYLETLIENSSLAVTGTFFQATQPVSNAGTFAVQLNATPSLANGNGVVPTQGGTVLSNTNGGYANILQGNAVLSATNGIYSNLLQGNAALTSSNGIFVTPTTGATIALGAGSATIGALTANQSVNTAQVNAVTVLTGAGATGTGSQRVTVAQDTTTIAGSAPGTAGTASANVVTVQGVASMTPVQVSQATASNLNATVVGAGTAGSASGGVLTVQGSSSGTAIPVTANAGTNLNTSALATSANLTAGTQIAEPITTVTNSALVKGTASQTSTTSTSLIGALASNRIYVLNASCSNSGASASVVAFQDGSGGTTLFSMEVPAGSGNNMAATFPLFWTTAGNALFFAPGTSSSTVYCNASGYTSTN